MRSKLLAKVRKEVTIEFDKIYNSYRIKVNVKFPHHSHLDSQRLISNKEFAYMTYRDIVLER